MRRHPVLSWIVVAVLAVLAVLVGPVGRAAEPSEPSAPRFPPELVEFGPPSATPLFTGGGPNAWDRDIRERGWIMREDGLWHLWYTGSSGDSGPLRRLGYATSHDGLNWCRRSAAPLIEDRWVEDMCIVRRGGCLFMVAEGENDVAHWLTSTDRIHWRPRGAVDIRGVDGRPISEGPRGTPTLWLDRGVWHLFYERLDKGVWLATSRDLATFTNVSDVPVLACGPDPCDAGRIALDQILRHRGRYYAYYHASPLERGPAWNTCIATSDDLVHWVKYAGNPVLPVDPEHPSTSSAMLVFDGRHHRLYTTHPDVRVRFSKGPSGP